LSSPPDVKIDIHLTQELVFPDEPLKTVLSFLFLIFGFLVTTLSLALTHERVPDYDLLPDIVLENTTFHQWGLKASEIIIILCIVLAFITVILHTHRMIVLRRVFFIFGLLYIYRGLTMFVTRSCPCCLCPGKGQLGYVSLGQLGLVRDQVGQNEVNWGQLGSRGVKRDKQGPKWV
jgi:hypothetical protein